MSYWIERKFNGTLYYLKEIEGVDPVNKRCLIPGEYERIWTTIFENKFLTKDGEALREIQKEWLADVDCYVTDTKRSTLVDRLPESDTWTANSKWSVSP